VKGFKGHADLGREVVTNFDTRSQMRKRPYREICAVFFVFHVETKMDRDEQKRIVKQQQAGFKAFHRFEVSEWRKATFADRLRDYAAIMEFAELIPGRAPVKPDLSVAERWNRIRARYNETH